MHKIILVEGVNAYICQLGSWAYGEPEPPLIGHKTNVTSGLPQFILPKFTLVPMY